MTQPLRNEKMPANPVWETPKDGFLYKTKDIDTWKTIAADYNMNPSDLIYYNFRTYNTDEVNWYLRQYLGCNTSTDGGRNWSFKGATNGFVYIPNLRMEGTTITAKKGVGGKIDAPEYDDDDLYDLISKALDIQGILDLGVGVSEVVLPPLLEAGLIGVSALAAVVGPLIAVGSGWSDALKKVSREHFFDGFTIGLVMTIDGASPGFIKSRYEKHFPIFNPFFAEKGKTFQNLYNGGLLLGIKKGKQFNTVDTVDLFGYVNEQLKDWEQEYYSEGDPRTWDKKKKRDFQERAASIIKQKIIAKDLKLEFR